MNKVCSMHSILTHAHACDDPAGARVQVPLSDDEKKAAEQSTETTAGTAAYQVSKAP